MGSKMQQRVVAAADGCSDFVDPPHRRKNIMKYIENMFI